MSGLLLASSPFFMGVPKDRPYRTRWGFFLPPPHFDWDLTGNSLPPYPEGLGALYRHVIEGGRGRKGLGEDNGPSRGSLLLKVRVLLPSSLLIDF